ncbi:phosphoglycerate mutase, 2,3-bisphosphoglycerate-independent [Actinidia rufa]|uniref:phosphoglycerate mutase (2,3-diphosphoglycerate-independent) n=1 Tax=Actinidia rufa TaxID=165716 RepID=A0A7J0GQH9_9ERIC|nr:phosphoglycerate mutase, 2,3-bisphosphoglycerate-independent [Actinidia rufa]
MEKQMVQEGALIAFALDADSSQEHFQKYYDAIMPYWKFILVNGTDNANCMLRAKAMECISLVGIAVGKANFRDDAKQTWARLCKCLGQDFLPYMSIVMPSFFQPAQLKPDVTITSWDSDNEIDESDDDRLVRAHGKAVGLPTEDAMGNSEVDHNALGVLDLLLKGASEHGAKRIRVHILTDGCDVLDGSSIGFVETLEKELAHSHEKGVDAQVASGGGCMYVMMDRYELLIKDGIHKFSVNPHKSLRMQLKLSKNRGRKPKPMTSTYLLLVIVVENGKPVGPIKDGDAVVTFNFRADRMCDGELKLPSHYLVSPPNIERTFGEYLVHNGVRTFACSDMVGHTGDIEATIVACKAADDGVKMILDAIEQVGGIYVVTADHWNAEDMVRIAIGGPGLVPGVRFCKDVPNGGLANVAATVMNLHEFAAPSDCEPTLSDYEPTEANDN